MVGQIVFSPAWSEISVNVPSPLLWKRRFFVLRSNRPPRLLAMKRSR